MGRKSTSNEEEKRIKQQEDREETFRAWLSKKQEKEKIRKQEGARRMEFEKRKLQQKQERGREAYDDWLHLKQQQARAEKKEAEKQKEIGFFEEEQRKEHLKQSQERFDRWRAQKDYELSLQKADKHTGPGMQETREPTPTVPGYCSVWSCDEELAPFMVQRVPRPNSYFVLPDTPEQHQQPQC